MVGVEPTTFHLQGGPSMLTMASTCNNSVGLSLWERPKQHDSTPLRATYDATGMITSGYGLGPDRSDGLVADDCQGPSSSRQSESLCSPGSSPRHRPGGCGKPGSLQYVLSTQALQHLAFETLPHCTFENVKAAGNDRPIPTGQTAGGVQNS